MRPYCLQNHLITSPQPKGSGNSSNACSLKSYTVRPLERNLDFDTIPVQSTHFQHYNLREKELTTGVNSSSPVIPEPELEPSSLNDCSTKYDEAEGAPISQGSFFDKLSLGQKKPDFLQSSNADGSQLLHSMRE
ncbi:hypothetical protein SOPP22_04075 [Shewanella sp. OPT22]|nr:hypothetical protein SOPP22_04075 [Shewanella sp. OPT22]